MSSCNKVEPKTVSVVIGFLSWTLPIYREPINCQLMDLIVIIAMDIILSLRSSTALEFSAHISMRTPSIYLKIKDATDHLGAANIFYKGSNDK